MRLALFITMETAAVVADGDKIPKGEDSGVNVVMFVMTRGAGGFGFCGGS